MNVKFIISKIGNIIWNLCCHKDMDFYAEFMCGQQMSFYICRHDDWEIFFYKPYFEKCNFFF